MNVVLHGWPDNPKEKRMHHTKTDEFCMKLIVPVMLCEKEQVFRHELIFRFIYHDGEYYHYEFVEPEFV